MPHHRFNNLNSLHVLKYLIFTQEEVKNSKRNITSKKIMSETKTIVLTVVRHGQTDANKERIVQGEEIFLIELFDF